MSNPSLSVVFYCADQNPHRDRSLGITSYTTGFLTHLRKLGDLELCALTSRSSFKLPPGIPQRQLPFRTDNPVGRLAADHLHTLLVQTCADLWHYPKGFLPLVFRPQVPIVATIHDTIVQDYADRYRTTRSAVDFAYWLHVLKKSIAHSAAIATISEFSKRAVLEFAERHRVKAPPIYVIYQAVGPVKPRHVSKRETVVHLASTLPHKRTRWLLETWLRLEDHMALPQLVLIGTLNAASAALVAKLKNVSVYPRLPREEMLDEIAAARALILPSEVEGFGLPALEAYLCGTPVVHVAGTAVAEVLGDDAIGSFTFDVDSFARALAQTFTLGSSEVFRKARELEARYTWDQCARRLAGVYHSVTLARRN